MCRALLNRRMARKMKDDITVNDEAEHGSTKQERSADMVDPVMTLYKARGGSDDESLLTDLLADLMHWADANDEDFGAAIGMARKHHDAESDD